MPRGVHMKILAHRANLDGPSVNTENSLREVERSLALGFGLETDIRRAESGAFYVAHDVLGDVPDGAAAELHAACWRQAAQPIALNVKEPGYEDALVDFVVRMNLVDKIFLFDMELVEPQPGTMARRFRALNPAIPIAARVSDRGESVEQALAIDVASVIWLDEFDGPWATRGVVQRLKGAGKTVYAVSPDLHGGDLAQAKRRWADFFAWNVDGICTDWSRELQQMTHSLQMQES